MKFDKKKQLLLIPLVFLLFLHIPAMIANIIPETQLQKMPELIWFIYVVVLSISMLIWCMLFLYIPLYIYVLILLLYTVISWILCTRKTKWDIKYCIVWITLCVVSILMYWKFGELYSSMINR